MKKTFVPIKKTLKQQMIEIRKRQLEDEFFKTNYKRKIKKVPEEDL